MIDGEFIREYCLKFAGSTEDMPWESHIAYKVGGKIFLIYNLGHSGINRLSLKTTPEEFERLIEFEFIIPAPYLARNKWVTIQDGCKIRGNELKELIKGSYELVFSKLPKAVKKKIVQDN